MKRNRPSFTRILSGLALAVFFCSASLIAVAQTEAARVETARAKQTIEINDVALKKLLDEHRAARTPLLINFWATWCAPCREEFPDLLKIQQDKSLGGYKFIFISLDDISEIETTVPLFLRTQPITKDITSYLLNASDPDVAINLIDREWSGALPATVLFDAEGKLVFKHFGRIKPDELRAAIKKATTAAAPEPATKSGARD